VLVIPNLLLLCARLMVDPRVPAKERLLVAGAIVYAFMPLDFIPDMIPFVGQVDDLYLIGLTLLRLMSVSDPRVVREHWRGGGDVVELIGASTLIAAKLLPKKIRRVLTSRVEAPSVPSGKSDTMATPLLIRTTHGRIEDGSIESSRKRPVDHTLDCVCKTINQIRVTCLQSPVPDLFRHAGSARFVKRDEGATERL
jgi:uncharacterized membrane protein YkvA (DUF1232 family)